MRHDGSDTMAALITQATVTPVGTPRRMFGTSLDRGDPIFPGKSSIGENRIGRLLTVEEVATLLNVPRRWVYRRVALKPPEGIPHVKVGKYVRFQECDVREYVERLRRN